VIYKEGRFIRMGCGCKTASLSGILSVPGYGGFFVVLKMKAKYN